VGLIGFSPRIESVVGFLQVGDVAEDVYEMAQFVVGGAVSVSIFERHCATKLRSCLTSFFNMTSTLNPALTDLSSIANGSQSLGDAVPALVMGDFADRAALAYAKCDFSDMATPVLSKLPHLKEVLAAQTVVARVGGSCSIFVESVQQTGGSPLNVAQVTVLFVFTFICFYY
jgi:hypothetical protein